MAGRGGPNSKRAVVARIEDQGARPTGAVGRVMAWVMSVLFRRLYRRIARHLDLQPADEVLDVACGSGVFLDLHASRARQVAGIDYSGVAVAMARRRLRDRIAAGSAEIVEGDATTLPWPDATFTAVTSDCLGCFAEPGRALAEAFRVLRPGGRAVFSFDVVPKERKPEAERRFVGWDVAEIRANVVRAGFSQVSVFHEGGVVLARGVKEEPSATGQA